MKDDEVAGEFALEHWKSRALSAEKELASARTVLAYLRTYHMKPTPERAENLIAERKKHDTVFWNAEHALRAVSEAMYGEDGEDK